MTVDHVETSADTVGGTAELGTTLGAPGAGRAGRARPRTTWRCRRSPGASTRRTRSRTRTTVPLKPAGGPDLEGRWLYEGPLALDRTGPYGYTVRILPAHRLLASGAELGLVAVPSEDDGGGRAGC